MAHCIAIAVLLLVGSSVVLLLPMADLRRVGASMCMSALAGLELGIGYDLPVGDQGVRRITGAALVLVAASFVSALCIGAMQFVRRLTRREANPRGAILSICVMIGMPGTVYLGLLLGVTVRERLLRW